MKEQECKDQGYIWYEKETLCCKKDSVVSNVPGTILAKSQSVCCPKGEKAYRDINLLLKSLISNPRMVTYGCCPSHKHIVTQKDKNKDKDIDPFKYQLCCNKDEKFIIQITSDKNNGEYVCAKREENHE